MACREPKIHIVIAGSGGHGGVGKHGDWQRKANDLVSRLQAYITVLERVPTTKNRLGSQTRESPPPEKSAQVAEVGGALAEEAGRGERSSELGLEDGSGSAQSSTQDNNPVAWIAAASAASAVPAGGVINAGVSGEFDDGPRRGGCCRRVAYSCHIM